MSIAAKIMVYWWTMWNKGWRMDGNFAHCFRLCIVCSCVQLIYCGWIVDEKKELFQVSNKYKGAFHKRHPQSRGGVV